MVDTPGRADRVVSQGDSRGGGERWTKGRRQAVRENRNDLHGDAHDYQHHWPLHTHHLRTSYLETDGGRTGQPQRISHRFGSLFLLII